MSLGDKKRLIFTETRRRSRGSRAVLSSTTVLFAAILLAFFGCEVKRPPGFLTVRKVVDLAGKSQFLTDVNLYIHHDQNGIAAMSTFCSYDRLPLKLITENGKQIFVSDYNPSRYDLMGHVIHGPSKTKLPFFWLRLDSGVYGGPKDTVYVEIGNEVSPEWRLPLPTISLAPSASEPSPPSGS